VRDGDGPDEAIADLLATAGGRLLRLAFQLCHRRSDVEDLVQQALEQACRRWRKRGVDADDAEVYARRAVVNEYLGALPARHRAAVGAS
jgi:DNA-directed RNA polymerase specialized sigma24 family protein